MTQEGDVPPQPKKPEGKEKAPPLNGADILSLGALTARALGARQTEVALLALKSAGPKLLESSLPALLICIPPVKPADPAAYLARAKEWFNNMGEGMMLARKKAQNFDKFTPEDEAKLDILTRQAIHALAEKKGGTDKLSKEDYWELRRCDVAILDRASWSQTIDGEAMQDTREKLNLAYLEIVSLTAKSAQFRTEKQSHGLDKTDMTPGGGHDTLVDFLRTVHDNAGNIKPEYKDAVIAKGDDGKIGIVTDAALAKKLHDEGRALTVEEVMFYLILGKTDNLKGSHDAQTRLLNELATNAHNTPRSGEGGTADPDTLSRPKKEEKGSLTNTVLTVLGTGLLSAAGAALLLEVLSKGRITRTLGKNFMTSARASLDRLRGRTSPPADPVDADVAARLGGDKMFRLRTRNNFRTQAESAVSGLDVAGDAAGSGERLSTFLNDFASLEGLDPRLDRGRLKVEVEFTTDPVARSEGMQRSAVTFSEAGGETTMKVTIPADAAPSEIAHDCYASLYELERSGKSSRRALTRADRAAISMDFVDLGVATERPDAGDRVASALPDGARGAAPEPVTIVFTGDSVTIGEHKYSVKEISEAIREGLDDRVKALDREGKRAGDADYDLAARDLADHELSIRDLGSTDRAVSRGARKAILDRARERYASDDGRRAHAIAEDPRRGGDRGRGRMMTLLLFAEKYATPAAALAVGLMARPDSARGDDAPVKPAELIPIIPVKREKE